MLGPLDFLVKLAELGIDILYPKDFRKQSEAYAFGEITRESFSLAVGF